MPENLLLKIFRPKGKAKLWWAFGLIMAMAVAGLVIDFGGSYNKAIKAYGLNLPQAPVVNFKLGLDLMGGSQLTYKADVSKIAAADQASAVEGARDVIERRVNADGVSEPLVQVNHAANGEYRILVELPGVKDIASSIKKIGETPLLEFKEQADPKATDAQKKEVDTFNKAAQKKAVDILGKLQKGGDFKAFTKESEDVATKDKGGDMGWITTANDTTGSNTAIAKALDNKTKGQLATDVVSSPEGYQVVRLNDKRIKKDAQGKEVMEVQAKHLLICYQGINGCTNKLTKEEALTRIKNLKGQINDKNFKDLVKANSTDPSAKDNFGELGWFTADMANSISPAFSKTVFAQKVGSISDPIETGAGYHLVLKEAEKKVTEYNVSRILIASKTLSANLEWQNTKLTGSNLKRATVQFAQTANTPEVSIEFDDAGAKLFEEITGRNVGKPVAIFLDGSPISVPTVNAKISGGKAVISGKFTVQESKDLAKRLNAGALPVPIDLINQQTVGATLGNSAVQSSLVAGLVGLLLVALFMIIFYRLPGVLSVVSLLIYGIVVLAIFKLWPVTLTLPGIAGFIMSIGIAVDANILIFERMREELRAGRTLTRAIEEGFSRAWSSIRDGNMSTIITCVVLMVFSASIIKGFAITLFLGILVSLFTAIVVTRTFLRLLNEKVLTKYPWLITKIKK